MSRQPSMRSRRALAGVLWAMVVALVGGPLAAPSGAAVTAAPMCPSTTANGRFVRQIYLQILERCPEPAAATHWTSLLDGGLDRGAFAETIDVSNENMVHNNVDPAFQSLLGRAPTTVERPQWVRNVRTLHGDAVLHATLAASSEHYNKIAGATPAAKDSAWLTESYQGILDRAPDPAGRAHFLAQFGTQGSTQNGRLIVALHLELSRENAQDWVGAVYGAAFGRGPDPSGVTYWVNWLLGPGHFQTFRMWTKFLSSNEGYALAQTQPNPSAGPM